MTDQQKQPEAPTTTAAKVVTLLGAFAAIAALAHVEQKDRDSRRKHAPLTKKLFGGTK